MLTVHEFGCENPNVLVMVHPAAVWWDVFSFVYPKLAEHYHVVIPAVPGMDPDQSDANFTSVEDVAQQIEDWLIAHGHGRIRCLYGCSMGGAVALRMVASGRIGLDCVLVDAGITPYQLWKPLTYLIGVRDFLMMEIGKHMSVRMLGFMFPEGKYTDEDLQYPKRTMGSMSATSIWRTFYSCNNYAMPDSIPQPVCPMRYMYGSEEAKDRKQDLSYIRKTFPDCEIVENEGVGHAELFTRNPVRFVQVVSQYIDAHAL